MLFTPLSLKISEMKCEFAYYLSNNRKSRFGIIPGADSNNLVTSCAFREEFTRCGEKNFTFPYCPRSGSCTIQDVALAQP